MLALQCMHDNLLKRHSFLLGAARKVVPLKRDGRNIYIYIYTLRVIYDCDSNWIVKYRIA